MSRAQQAAGHASQQPAIDTLAKLGASGNVVVVPEGFGGIVNVK